MHYVVYCCEHLRDGLEEWAKVCDSIESALSWINKGGSSNITYRLFELGKEVPLVTETIEEHLPPVIKTKIVLKG